MTPQKTHEPNFASLPVPGQSHEYIYVCLFVCVCVFLSFPDFFCFAHGAVETAPSLSGQRFPFELP